MPDAGVAGELAHVAGTEDVAYVTRRLVHVKHRTLAGHDAGSLLTAVLQQQQAVIQELVNRRMRNSADDSTHSFYPKVKLPPPSFTWTPVFAGRPGLVSPVP